jgi:hypothetical protein
MRLLCGAGYGAVSGRVSQSGGEEGQDVLGNILKSEGSVERGGVWGSREADMGGSTVGLVVGLGGKVATTSATSDRSRTAQGGLVWKGWWCWRIFYWLKISEYIGCWNKEEE